jgi:septal ring factor EnvC (AmiA/AmiB activator)
MGEYLPRRLETPSSALPAADLPKRHTLSAVDDQSFTDGRCTVRDGRHRSTVTGDEIETLRRVIDTLLSERNQLEQQLRTTCKARDAAEVALRREEVARQAADRRLNEVQQDKCKLTAKLETARQRIGKIRGILGENKGRSPVSATVM